MFVVDPGRVVWVLLLLLACVGVGLFLARRRHEARASATGQVLDEAGDGTPFSPEMVDGLPEPARRHLLHALAPGTPLAASVRFTMTGWLRPRPGGRELPLQAREILSARGLVWLARVGSGPGRLVGFDRYLEARGEMRWWLAGILPIASATGPDVSRSAAGRVAAESVLIPSLLLPRAGARWAAVDSQRARVTRRVDGEEVTLTLTVAGDGRLAHVSLLRWRENDGAGEPGAVRFDVLFEGELEAGGYRIPAAMKAGWRLGATDEFPFLQTTLEDVRYR